MKGRRRRRWCCLCAVLVFAGSAFPQTEAPRFDPPVQVPEAIRFFAPLFFPKLIQDTWQLRDYVRSDDFAMFRRTYGDVYAIDALFDRAKRLSWNNLYEALLISLLASLDHRRVGVNIPVLGPLLWIPLTSEFEDEFAARVKALPARLVPDSPHGAAGDRDKLQHFFGSAFFAYTLESADAAERIGNFVEWGENAFVVGGGGIDARDVEANRRGQRFGLWLLGDETVLPSRFFVRPLAPDTTHSVPESR